MISSRISQRQLQSPIEKFCVLIAFFKCASFKVNAFPIIPQVSIVHQEVIHSVYKAKRKPIVGFSSASGSNDNMSTSTQELDRGDLVEILDRSLRQHTSLGILEQIQIMYGKDNDIDDSEEANSSPIISSLDEIHTTMRFSLLSHGRDEGTIDGALHNYANFGALTTFQTKKDVLLEIPARKLARVGAHQYELEDKLHFLKSRIGGRDVIENYNGFRCTKNQEVFYIRQGLMWNCYDDDGEFFGQALLFDRDKIEFMQ